MNSQHPTKVVVLGGGYAGTLAALRLAGKTKRRSVDVLLINGHDHFVERIRHHQRATRQSQAPLPFQELLAGSGVRFLQEWCTEIAPAGKQITVQTAGGTETVGYDYLIYALGSTVDKAAIPGDRQNVYTLGDLHAVDTLAQRLPTMADNHERLLIVGGGLTGIEAATEFAEQYPQLPVTLVTKGTLGAALSPAGATHLRRVFARLRIELIEGVTVERFTDTIAHCSDGRTIAFGGALWAGAFAVPRLAAAAGLPVDSEGRLVVDGNLRVLDHAAIYAAGDAAATGLRMGCVNAMPMGAYVADHLAAVLNNKARPAPFQFGYLIRCISLGRHDGLVQFVHADDTPKPRVLTGWIATRIKELICRFTVWSLFWEKRWPGLYSWVNTRPILAPAHATVAAGPRTATAGEVTAGKVATGEVMTGEVPMPEQGSYGQTAANL